MAVYNLTNVSGTTDMLLLMQGLNQLSEGVLGMMIWISFMVIMFGNLKLRTTADGGTIAAATLFSGFIVVLILEVLSLVPNWFIGVGLVGAALAVLIMLVRNSD